MTFSRSLDLSKPTFLITYPPGMGEVDSVGCYRHLDKGSGVEGIVVLGSSVRMSAHMCISAHKGCVATVQSQERALKDAQLSVYLPQASPMSPTVDPLHSMTDLHHPPQGIICWLYSPTSSEITKTYQEPTFLFCPLVNHCRPWSLGLLPSFLSSTL